MGLQARQTSEAGSLLACCSVPGRSRSLGVGRPLVAGSSSHLDMPVVGGRLASVDAAWASLAGRGSAGRLGSSGLGSSPATPLLASGSQQQVDGTRSSAPACSSDG